VNSELLSMPLGEAVSCLRIFKVSNELFEMTSISITLLHAAQTPAQAISRSVASGTVVTPVRSLSHALPYSKKLYTLEAFGPQMESTVITSHSPCPSGA
jgi:hypothetical protein